MSKTDKTAPWTVRVFNKSRWLVEWHDHRTSDCDLPPRPKPGELESVFHYNGHCGWYAGHDFWCDRENACGCSMCNQSEERRQEVRKERHQAKRYAQRDWRKEY